MLQTSSYARIKIKNAIDARHGQQVLCPVYRIGHVATLLSRSAQTVKIWIREGRLPEPTSVLDKGGRRDLAWTYDQLRLIWEYIPLLNFPDKRDEPPRRPDPEEYEKGRHDASFKKAQLEYEHAMSVHRKDHAAFSRWLHEDWAKMPDGVLPIWRQP